VLGGPKKGLVRVESNYGSTPTENLGTSVTTGASSGTKGSVAELIASTAFDAWEIIIAAANYGTSNNASPGCLDILIGAATEEVLIPDLLMGGCSLFGGNGITGSTGPKMWKFPLYIPAGSRLSAQAAGGRTSTAFRVGIWLRGGDGSPPFRVGRKVTTYGVSSVPNGVTISPSGGTFGAWAEITAGTSEDHFALVPSYQPNDSSLNSDANLVQIGIGSATEEAIGDYLYMLGEAERMGGPVFYEPTFADIPAGTRLAMRGAYSGSADTVNGAIHGVS
jgi:hypothetical protein